MESSFSTRQNVSTFSLNFAVRSSKSYFFLGLSDLGFGWALELGIFKTVWKFAH